ncbi:alpha/beta hydrolase [Paraglaciecola hydrolytica]|uniref:Esterase n=1 Tax=Paraglaciecola hydrolytica TaxID=1799789 RepID=A0A136A531_9ALTE|nr:alpha/beta hydrolase-fold protein [Paraglaciecola hydrolytica]KXI30358.1 hypothetical protein AX660_10315 [Paraglaciecola hydrolytica]
MRTSLITLLLSCLLCSTPVLAVVSDNIRIHSEILSYDLQYRIYRPANVSPEIQLPVVYVTDGEWYLHELDMPKVLDKLINKGAIHPLQVVFVDSRNPDDLTQNRRNQQFMCNKDYVLFFVNELIPKIETQDNKNTAQRLIVGLSFGGINAACFGLMLPDVFPNIAMLSPFGNEKVSVISDLYRKQDKLALKLFLSVGKINDSASSVRKFKQVLLNKNYDLTYKEVNFGHEWDNWRSVMNEMLLTFFALPK